jgi:hypothetical protein
MAGRAFSFFTSVNLRATMVSFEWEGSAVDVFVPDAGTVPGEPSVATTTPDGITRSEACELAGRTMNRPLLYDAAVSPSGFDASDFDPAKLARRFYGAVTRETTHGEHGSSKVSYPIIGDEAIDAEIVGFTEGGCFGEDDLGPGATGECVRAVAGTTARRGDLLVLVFSSYEYSGGPHGLSAVTTQVFRKTHGKWKPLAPNLIADSPACKRRVGSMLYRQLWHGLADARRDGADLEGHFELVKMADQTPSDKGIVFAYNPYSLDGYIPPGPGSISYRDLGKCFSPRPVKSLAPLATT